MSCGSTIASGHKINCHATSWRDSRPREVTILTSNLPSFWDKYTSNYPNGCIISHGPNIQKLPNLYAVQYIYIVHLLKAIYSLMSTPQCYVNPPVRHVKRLWSRQLATSVYIQNTAGLCVWQGCRETHAEWVETLCQSEDSFFQALLRVDFFSTWFTAEMGWRQFNVQDLPCRGCCHCTHNMTQISNLKAWTKKIGYTVQCNITSRSVVFDMVVLAKVWTMNPWF